MAEPVTRISRAWQVLFVEPFYWFRLCFVQPTKFRSEIEVDSNPSIFAFRYYLSICWKRFTVMCKMFVFLLFLSYFFAILLRFIFLFFFREAFGFYLPSSLSLSHLSLVPFLLDALGAVLIVLCLSTLVGSLCGLAMGIAFGFAGNIWAGVTVHPSLGTGAYNIVLGLVLLILAIFFGIAISSATNAGIKDGAGTVGSLIGGVLGLLLGIPAGIAGGYLGGFLVHIGPELPWSKSLLGSMSGATIGLLLAVMVAPTTVGIVRGSMREKRFNVVLARALAVGSIFCIAAGGIAGGAVGTYISNTGLANIRLVFTSTILPYLPTVLIFSVIGFILGFSRLPLYPFSSVTMYFSYRASQKEPLKVFDFLHTSALYWDEYVPLPLPGLKQMLQMGAMLDEERVQEEINFIVTERSSQVAVAQAVTLENTLDKLEECENLAQISKASQQLGKILPGEAGLIDPRWVKSLAALNDACRSATNYRYRTPHERQARIDALDELIVNLRRVHPARAFENLALNKRLSGIVERWLKLARQEREKVEQSSMVVGFIDNPYVCGPALKANNPLFVGRRDIVQRLDQPLNRDAHRPCFFLTGERRMGKTSTLNQLSDLLSTRYLPIILDLQARGISASTSAFLAEIADVIYRTMDGRGIRIQNKLGLAYLREMSRENEAEAYRIFDEWFRGVEALLEKENRTLLLAFDEFEKLEEANAARFLDLNLLLDWFRFMIQNHTRLALLFSGVRTLNEMGSNWSGHLVNVKTLRVGLLRSSDAYKLITEPVSDYPGEEIFGKEVVDEIMHITGCHPFLIQAVCSELIDILNADNRKQARLPDVASAATEVLQGWWDTYFRDLWERTPVEQRLCLTILRRPGEATLEEVTQQTGMDTRTVLQALTRLNQRDLVLCKDGGYSIVAPMFEKWVELNLE